MIEESFYKPLISGQQDSSEHLIENGKTLYLSELGGDASFDSQTVVSIVIEDAGGTEIIFSTSGSQKRNTTREFIGDGVRKIIINITNNMPTPQTIGAYWIGREL